MRLRRKNKKTYYLKKRLQEKDSSGYLKEGYSEPIEVIAEIYPASGKMQSEIYGEKINRIMNMLYDGKVEINEGDYLCVNVSKEENPDYRVLSVKKYTYHTAFELEMI